MEASCGHGYSNYKVQVRNAAANSINMHLILLEGIGMVYVKIENESIKWKCK